MAKNNRNKQPKARNDLNYYETTGSVAVNTSEANSIIDKSMEAVSENMLKKKAEQ